MEAIKASLARWGQRQPIVVQRNGMVVRAGNGRLEAAKAIGWTHIAAVVVDDESADAVAFAIADNRTAELAEWDTETLATLLDTLPQEVKVDTGFTDADLDAMLKSLTPIVPMASTGAKEIDVESFNGQCKCPRCGFEYDPKP
jgi:ParB-like chromosome segregation protein Spo0J